MTKPLFIRADGNAQIGLGHIIRCISLAHMLKDEFEIRFYLKSPDAVVFDLVGNDGFNANEIQEEQEFLDFVDQNSYVVLDGYHFDTPYQTKLKESVKHLMFIDDLHDRTFDAHTILNHAPNDDQERYQTVSGNTAFLLGPEYALLRPIFLEPNKQVHTYDVVKNVFICFGGSDFKNRTKTVLDVIDQENVNLTVVLGPSFPYQNEIEALVQQRKHPDDRILSSLSAKEMKSEMAKSDLVIVPASGILFEAIAVGVPIISGYYTDNQLDIYEGFKEKKVFVDAGEYNTTTFSKAWDELSSVNLSSLVSNQRACIDGKSGDRILNHLLKA